MIKKKQITDCETKTRKFKIAGVSTLGATGVGVVGNIALHNKIQNMGSGGSGGGAGAVADTRTEAQKVSDECKMQCKDFPDDPDVLEDCNNCEF
jgi:hypothetical protein